MLARYDSGRYEILSGLQIHKFSETRSIPWDPEGQQRLVAHYVLNDICVTPPGGEKVVVKRASMFVCSKFWRSLIFTDADPEFSALHTAYPSSCLQPFQIKNVLSSQYSRQRSEGMIPARVNWLGEGRRHLFCLWAADVRFLHWSGFDLAVLR